MRDRWLILAALALVAAIVYQATRPDPAVPAPKPAARAPAPPPAPAPPRMAAPVMPRELGTLYYDEPALRAHIEYLGPQQQAIAIDDTLVKPGFGPPIRFHRNPDGTLTR